MRPRLVDQNKRSLLFKARDSGREMQHGIVCEFEPAEIPCIQLRHRAFGPFNSVERTGLQL
jgi:hypothetical protein